MNAPRRLLVAGLAIGLGLGGATAHAQPAPSPNAQRDEAKRHFQTGVALFNRGDLVQALDEFQRSYQLNAVPVVLHNIGLTQKGLGRWRDALASFDDYLRVCGAQPGCLTPARRAEVDEWEAELRAHLATSPAPVAAPASTPSAPPPVVEPAPPASEVVAEPARDDRSGFAPFVHTGRGKAALALGALGVASFVAAIGTGSESLSVRSSYDRGCNAGACDQARYDHGRALAIATDALIGVGVASAVVTTILVLTRPRHAPVVLAPFGADRAGGLVLGGRF